MWKFYLAFLSAIAATLLPGVGSEDDLDLDGGDPGSDDDNSDPEPDDGNGDDDNVDPDPEDDLDGGDPQPSPKPVSRAQRTIIETRARAQKAEDELRRAHAELEAARRQPAQSAQPSEEQRIWEQEEAVLRNPESSDWQKYAVQANRQARSANSNSQNALRRAEDLADRTKFEQLSLTKPKLFSSYKDRVEEELTRIRATGSNAPREELLALLVGRDLRDGKLKTSSVGSTKKAGAPRNAPPSVRSDVTPSGGGRLSEAEKRAKRLENIRI
jgi:hypothetical protein